MAVTYERFELALTRLEGAQWRLFERLASVYMQTEFAALRPVADPSGDGGADALLFRPEDDPSVIVQYSVRSDFRAKVLQTGARLKETFAETKVLIYVTNQLIASKGAELRRDVRTKYGIHLDIRDREWLLTERNAGAANMAEAEELARAIVDPILATPDAIQRQGQALDDLEAKAAFVYLGLQWADDTREKGLTKLCFEALVRSVLRDTTSDVRMPRDRVRQLVGQLLPAHHKSILDVQVDGALGRLSKKYIRHWRKPDEFCLTWEERVRLSERIVELSTLNDALVRELRGALAISAAELGETPDEAALESLADFCRTVLERVFLDRGEAFASAVARDASDAVRFEDVEVVLDRVLAERPQRLSVPAHVLASTLQSILISPPEDVRRYLRGLADTYTLFAFMRETPDVQSAVVKMFSDADIWLDTSVVLPLLAEELLQPQDRSHSELFAAAIECGLRLYITDGVLEEVVTHLQRCAGYHRASGTPGGAKGSAPFLYNAYLLAGRDAAQFERWLSEFYGADPESDVLDYLEDEHRIRNESLERELGSAPLELRAAVAEIWYEARDARERRMSALGVPPMDQVTRSKLISHDVENYVGVVMRRDARGEKRSAFGYRTWWLTLDGNAFRIHDKLKSTLEKKPPSSPAISPDFMLNYLAIGPIRGRLSKRKEETLPLMLNMSVLDAVPTDLMELAEELRKELADLNPRVVRRKIKETLEDARKLMGPKATAGEIGLNEEVRAKLLAQARER